MKKYCIGIDLGATNTKIGLFDDERLVTYLQEFTDPDAELDRLLDFIEGLVHKLLQQNDLGMDQLQCVGVAIPAYVDRSSGMIPNCNYIMAFNDAPLARLLQDRLGVHVTVENDANAAAIAEHRFGAGQGQDNMIYAALATGIGGGLILNGKLFRGMHGMAGEIGHMFISDSIGYPCPCGVTGCVQSISSGAHMAKYATDRIKEGEDSAILNYAGTLSNIDMVAVGKALMRNDPLALEVVNRGAEALGRMFHSLNQIFDINFFVYGGGVAKLGSRFIDRMIAAYRHYSLMDQRYPAQFLPAAFGDRAGMYGAALLAQEESQPQS